MTANLLIALGLGYLLGSIPFGLLLTRLAGRGDLRRLGSGNIGATNVLRTGSKGLAAATLLLDAAKGAAAVLIARQWLPGMEQAAAAGAMLGHLYPLWLGLRGGKGVATLLGLLAVLLPIAAAIYAAIWVGMLVALRISSVAGIAAAISAPLAAALLGRFDLVTLLLAFALLVVWKHRSNIARLREGTEPRIGSGKAHRR